MDKELGKPNLDEQVFDYIDIAPLRNRPNQKYEEIKYEPGTLRPDFISMRLKDAVNPCFYEARDTFRYHMCDLPQHTHHIPVWFTTCYGEGAWTWEDRYQ